MHSIYDPLTGLLDRYAESRSSLTSTRIDVDNLTQMTSACLPLAVELPRGSLRKQ